MSQITHDHPDLWSHPDEAQALADQTDRHVSALVTLLDGQGHILDSSAPADAIHVGEHLRHPGRCDERAYGRAGQDLQALLFGAAMRVAFPTGWDWGRRSRVS